ncbi:MAG: Hpt domain-containing protein [Synergistaceae bacterium]|jgi:HPt (histidine-containing phosphotransfer) domain-containing protein|nr:Hpt domain-containing protein [Synergistaceae bacterium]
MDEHEIAEYLDAAKGLPRVLGKVALYKKLLSKFLADTGAQVDRLKKEIEANDRAAASVTVHTIKGVAGNLSMTKLYEASLALEALLKTEAEASAAEYAAVYEKTVKAVEAYMQNNS